MVKRNSFSRSRQSLPNNINRRDMEKLSYTNEDDKCYGATGMAIGIVVFDGEDKLAGVGLDADPGDMMEMHSSFYFSGNPGLSAKSAWAEMRENFSLSVAMMISNVMCRRMVLDRTLVAPEVRQGLQDTVVEEGRDACSLEEDEVRRIFDKEYTYLFRVFNHQGVHRVAHEFADALKRRRHLSRLEVLEELRALSSL